VKKLFLHFSLALLIICLTAPLAPSVLAKADDAGVTVASPQSDATTRQQNEAQMPASGEATTHEAKIFSGRITKENGELVLKDPVTKVTHKLDDPAKAKEYIDKQVKVTGKLDINSNTIQIENISVP
jgi:hypothetical protein